jgi:electron transfer flavoprotein alpha subunit
VTEPKKIWVLPEINGNAEEISKLTLRLLSEANVIAESVGGAVTALILDDHVPDYSEIFCQYAVNNVCTFTDPALKYFSAGAYAAALLPKIHEEKPWLVLMGDTTVGRELSPLLAASLGTGMVSKCAMMELSNPDQPLFYRYVYGDQLFQEISFRNDLTMLVTMDSRVLNVTPAPKTGELTCEVIESKLPPDVLKVKHIDFLPADFMTMDVADASVIVSAGMGALSDEVLPLVEELSGLIEGSIGTTRPVVDSGKIARERMIGQTGKVVSPAVYLALGISGASHHVGGIQDAGKIVSINRDPEAAIFKNSDVGIVADLKEVLPLLIEKIKQAKKDGKIL